MIPGMRDTADRLRRTKSARSFRKSRPLPIRPVPFDPDLARHHATTAASYAMLHSGERSSIESKSPYYYLGGLDSMAMPQRCRRSSVIQPARDIPNTSYVSAAGESAPRQSEERFAENADPCGSLTAALPPICEFGGLDGRDSEAPSSYRRLRKAKSMFSTRHHLSHAHYAICSPQDGANSIALEVPRPERTLRRSMSFLRGSHPTKAVRPARCQSTSIHVEQAYSPQNKETEGEQVCALAPITHEYKPFKKTFRATSAPGPHAVGMLPWADEPTVSTSRKRARTISKTIKTGVKRMLGLSRPQGEPGPATPSPTTLSQYDRGCHISNLPVDHGHTPCSHPSYNTEPEDDIFGRCLTMRRKRSSDSVATTKSRVTSWADSTVNTIAMWKTVNGSSLSVIDEYGDTSRTPQQTPGNSRHKRILHESPLGLKSNTTKQNRSIDSQRLYSALMKRIGRGNMQISEDGATFGAVSEHRLVPECTSSAYSRCSKHTIRHVASNESVISPGSYATAYCDLLTPAQQSGSYSGHSPLPLVSEPSQSRHGKHSGTRGCTGKYAQKTEQPSKEESGNIMNCDLDGSEHEPYSPSVYSRAADTPTGKDGIDDRHQASNEPGMVTILSSKRAVYRSPKRQAGALSPGVPIQPSLDWQKWMAFEVGRLESPRSIKDHPWQKPKVFNSEDFRSQYPLTVSESQEKYRSDLTSRPRLATAVGNSTEPWATNKFSLQSNFSRPFSRTPSMCTIAIPQAGLESDAIQPPNSVFPTPEPAAAGPGLFGGKIPQLPMGSGPASMTQAPESPTPRGSAGGAPQRRTTDGQCRRYSTRRAPGMLEVKAQVRPFRAQSERRKETNENIKNDDGRGSMNMMDRHKLQDIHSTISSKRMVEMFLDSRRRHMGEDSSDAFL